MINELPATDTAVRANRSRCFRIVDPCVHRARLVRHRFQSCAIAPLTNLTNERPFRKQISQRGHRCLIVSATIFLVTFFMCNGKERKMWAATFVKRSKTGMASIDFEVLLGVADSYARPCVLVRLGELEVSATSDAHLHCSPHLHLRKTVPVTLRSWSSISPVLAFIETEPGNAIPSPPMTAPVSRPFTARVPTVPVPIAYAHWHLVATKCDFLSVRSVVGCVRRFADASSPSTDDHWMRLDRAGEVKF